MNGFVASHIYKKFFEKTTEVCIGLDIGESFTNRLSIDCSRLIYRQANLLDDQAIGRLLSENQVTKIIHLASYSSVAFSWENPKESFVNNTNIFLNLVEAVRKHDASIPILSVGSSEEYAQLDNTHDSLDETYPLTPFSPYAAARISQEHLSQVYSKGYGMNIIMTRSFNHMGPGQDDRFFIPAIAAQLVNMKKQNKKRNDLFVGNLGVVRDFIDVRDVAEAYLLLLQRGQSGEVYNVCSGIGYSLEEVIKKMTQILDVEVNIKVDPSKLRPNENPRIIGNPSRIIERTGWKLSIPVEVSLLDIITEKMNE